MRLTLFFIFLSLHSLAQWEQLLDFPGEGRDDAVGFVLNNEVFVGTGRDVNFGCTTDFWKYSVNTGLWSQGPSLPGEGRQYSAACSLLKGEGQVGLVVGGVTCDNKSLNEVWQFTGSEWIRMADFPGKPRYRALLIEHRNKLWLYGGRSGLEALNEVWSYNVFSDEWKREGDLPFGARFDLAGYQRNSQFYLGMGSDSAGTGYKDWWRFDPPSGKWHQQLDYPGKNSVYNVALSNGNQTIVCTGSNTKNTCESESWEFDALNLTWQPAAVVNTMPFKGSVGLVVNDSFYLVCGIDSTSTRLKSMWKLSFPDVVNDGNSVQIYPNPAVHNVSIQAASGKEMVGDLVILDGNGKVFYFIQNAVFPYFLNVEDMPVGAYVVRTPAGKATFMRID